MNRHLAAHNRFLAEVYPDEKPCESILYLDVETRSEADLKKVGAWEYAAHPSTEIMNASFAIDDTLIQRWLETDDMAITEAIPELSDPAVLLCFHNAEFETAIFTEVCGLTIPTHRILDSAAVARHANLPGALEPLGAFFGFDKDMDGNRIMLKLSKPRRPSKANPDRFWRPETKPEDFEKTYEYCDRDVEVSRHAMNSMPAMSVFESQVYAATFDMNRCGVAIDRDSAQRMHATAEKEKDRLSKEIERDFGFTLGQVSQIADYLGLDSVAKAPLRDLLKDPFMPEDQRRVAEARQTFAKTSLNKLPKFLSRSKTDGRARGNLIYGGAERTVRWCIAEGELVLTRDRGQVPIQDITSSDFLWDGYQWVSCDGVVYSGVKEVVSYQGLTASKDHKVFVSNTSSIRLEDAIKNKSNLWRGYVHDILHRSAGFEKIHWSDEELQSSDGITPICIKENFTLDSTQNHPKVWMGSYESDRATEEHSGQRNSMFIGEVVYPRDEDQKTKWDEHNRRWRGERFRNSELKEMEKKQSERGMESRLSERKKDEKREASPRSSIYGMVRSISDSFFEGSQSQAEVQGFSIRSKGTRNSERKGKNGFFQGTIGSNENKVDIRSRGHEKPTLQSERIYRPEEASPCCECRVEKVVGRPEIRPGEIQGLYRKEKSYARCYDVLNAGPRNRFMVSGVIASNSGSGIQMQNLTRGIGELQDTAFSALESGLFEYLYDDEIIDILSGMLRGLIREKNGIFVGDYAQIEARMLAWLAGDDDLLDQFRRGLDPYRIMAGAIYHIDVSQVTDFQRFLGKQAILGSGYGLGYRGFMTMLDQTYDVQVEVTEAKSVTEAYRKNAPKIVSLWKRLERGMLAARSQIGKIVKVNDKIGITFPKLDEMHIILPSKRRLRYYQVKLDIKENGFTSWTCYGKQKTGAGYGRVSIYGGAITGHITQSSARDVMASAIVRLWRRGYPLILTVHDEIVSLAHGPFQAFSDHMEVTPDWLTDFPLKVDAFETIRYKK